MFYQVRSPGGRGRGKLLIGVYTGSDSAPRSIPRPFIYHFWQKRHPFCIPSSDRWYPFHLPALEHYIPFNCFKSSVFKYEQITKLENFVVCFTSIKLMRLLAPFFKERNDRFPNPFIYLSSTNQIRTLL